MTWLTVTGLVYGRTMFVGHFAVGFAAKRFAPKTSLGAQDRSAAAAIAAGVFSHWILDVVTHSPDMPITSLGATKIVVWWASRFDAPPAIARATSS